MRVLVGCERSGIVRDAFLARGHKAISCDLVPSERPGPHYQGDIRDILHAGWDLFIAHPDCTYLSSSGLHWNKRIPGRQELSDEALRFAVQLALTPIERICVENPVGRFTKWARAAGFDVQTIQPYQFGHDASKTTCLILKNLLPLVGTDYIQPRIVGGKPRWANQTDSGQNRLGPSATRAMDRARTYEGIADAMARQWG